MILLRITSILTISESQNHCYGWWTNLQSKLFRRLLLNPQRVKFLWVRDSVLLKGRNHKLQYPSIQFNRLPSNHLPNNQLSSNHLPNRLSKNLRRSNQQTPWNQQGTQAVKLDMILTARLSGNTLVFPSARCLKVSRRCSSWKNKSLKCLPTSKSWTPTLCFISTSRLCLIARSPVMTRSSSRRSGVERPTL